jgi:MFS family permease
MVVVFRALGGLSSAGGSVTLGMVADMWGPSTQQYAVAFVVFSSVGGSIVGPVIGGVIEKHLSLRWNFWIQLMLGVVVQAVHYCTVPETRASCIVTKEAQRRSRKGENIISEDEFAGRSLTKKDIVKIWLRPFHMFLFEPIVLFLSLLSGFSDALIFTFLDAFGRVYKQWGFDSVGVGMAFLPIGLGYVIAWLIWTMVIYHDNKIRRRCGPEALTPEHRLKWLMWTAPGLVIGCLCFAWTGTGPPMHWSVPMVFSVFIGIANVNLPSFCTFHARS